MEVLIEGNELIVEFDGFDDKGKPKPVDPTFEMEYVPDVPGIVADSPKTGTQQCAFTFLAAGTVVITATAKNANGQLITGTVQIQTQAAPATHLVEKVVSNQPIP